MMSFVRLREVHDGQHHENECLQRDHQDVEAGPDHAEQQLADGTTDAAERGDGEAATQHREQQEDHLAGVQVAVETQAQRNGARQVFDEVQQQVERHHPLAERMGEQFPAETAEAFDLETVEHHDQEHADRHAQRDVEIGGRHDLQVLEPRLLDDQRKQVQRHDVHDVEQQDPAENGERQWRDQLAGAVEAVTNLRVDELDHDLDEALELARHAGRGLARGDIEGAGEQHAKQYREEDAVDVHRPETVAMRQVGQVVNDVLAPGRRGFGGVFGC